MLSSSICMEPVLKLPFSFLYALWLGEPRVVGALVVGNPPSYSEISPLLYSKRDKERNNKNGFYWYICPVNHLCSYGLCRLTLLEGVPCESGDVYSLQSQASASVLFTPEFRWCVRAPAGAHCILCWANFILYLWQSHTHGTGTHNCTVYISVSRLSVNGIVLPRNSPVEETVFGVKKQG